MADADVIRFKYTKSKDYRVIPANGVFGGISPRGDFKMEFFIESNGIPEEIHHSITPEGLGPEIGRLPEERKIEREVQISIVMTPSQAKSFAHWILNHVDKLEQKKQ